MMWIARVTAATAFVTRIDDQVASYISYSNERATLRPRQPRAWRFAKPTRGASAVSQSPEGALSSARVLFDEPEVEVDLQRYSREHV